MRTSDIDVLIALVPDMKLAWYEIAKEYERRLECYPHPLTTTMLAVDIMLWSAIHGRKPREE